MLPVHLISLNVGHQTYFRPVPTPVLDALLDQKPDILVLVEYVEGHGRPELRAALVAAGLSHFAASDSRLYSGKASWWNQVFIASRWPIKVTSDRAGMRPCNGCGFLSVGCARPGGRASTRRGPAPRFQGDLLIGDLNPRAVPVGGLLPHRDARPGQREADGGWSF